MRSTHVEKIYDMSCDIDYMYYNANECSFVRLKTGALAV